MRKSLLYLSVFVAMISCSLISVSCVEDSSEDEEYLFDPANGKTKPPKMKNGYNKGIGLYSYRALVQIGSPLQLYAKKFKKEELIEISSGCLLKDVKWWSENEEIAKVDANTGVVTGVSPGYVYIYAYTEDGRAARCYVKVEPKSAKYGVAVAGYELTAYNYKDVENFPGVKGGIRFEPKDSTLALNNCTITLTDSVEGIYAYKDHIKIYNLGKSHIKTNHTSALAANSEFYSLYKKNSVTFTNIFNECLTLEIDGNYWRTSDDKLTFESRGNNGSYDVGSGMSVSGGTMVKVYNCDLEVKGAQAGCSGYRWHDYSNTCFFATSYYWDGLYTVEDFTRDFGKPVAWPSSGYVYLTSCRLTATCDKTDSAWGCVIGTGGFLLNQIDTPSGTEVSPTWWEKGSILYIGGTALCTKGTDIPVKGTVVYEDSREYYYREVYHW